MRRILTAASLFASLSALLATTSCAESPAFRHATYLGYAYEYDQDTQLPVLQARNTDPGRHWNNAFRGRNWR
jgi:hypothetical protein